MARSQPKTTPKPLMIRGDRLLLALHALSTMFDHHPVAGMSSMRVRRAINRLLNRPPNGDCPPLAYAHGQLDPADMLRLVLRTGGDTLSAVTFDARVLLDRVHSGNYLHVPEYLERFFTAIASGELTEKDFRATSGTKR